MKGNDRGYVAVATLIFVVSITVLLGSLMISLQQNITLKTQQRNIEDIRSAQNIEIEKAIQAQWRNHIQRLNPGLNQSAYFYTESTVVPSIDITASMIALSAELEEQRNAYGLPEKSLDLQIERVQ